MAHLHNQDNQLPVLYLINNSIITDPHPVKLLLALQLNAIDRTRIFFERVKRFAQPLIKFFIGQRAQELFRRPTRTRRARSSERLDKRA